MVMGPGTLLCPWARYRVCLPVVNPSASSTATARCSAVHSRTRRPHIIPQASPADSSGDSTSNDIPHDTNPQVSSRPQPTSPPASSPQPSSRPVPATPLSSTSAPAGQAGTAVDYGSISLDGQASSGPPTFSNPASPQSVVPPTTAIARPGRPVMLDASARIKATTTWQQLLDIVQELRPQLDYVMVSTALLQLAQLFSPTRSSTDEGDDGINFSPASSATPSAFPSDLLNPSTNTSSATNLVSPSGPSSPLRPLTLPPTATVLLEALLQLAHVMVDDFDSAAICRCMAALAALRRLDDHSSFILTEDLMLAAQFKLDTFPPHHLAGILVAASRLGYCPTADWRKLFYAAADQNLSSWGPAEVSSTLRALGALGERASCLFVGKVLRQGIEVLDDFTASQLTDTLWGAVKLQALHNAALAGDQPDGNGKGGGARPLTGSSMKSQQVGSEAATSASEEAALGKPEHWVLRPYVRAASIAASSKGQAPHQVCRTLWAVAQLLPPSDIHLAAPIVEAACPLVRHMATAQAVQVVWALGRLRCRIGPLDSSDLLSAIDTIVPRLSAEQLSEVLHSITVLRLTPGPARLHTYLSALMPLMPQLLPRQFAALLHSLSFLLPQLSLPDAHVAHSSTGGAPPETSGDSTLPSQGSSQTRSKTSSPAATVEQEASSSGTSPERPPTSLSDPMQADRSMSSTELRNAVVVKLQECVAQHVFKLMYRGAMAAATLGALQRMGIMPSRQTVEVMVLALQPSLRFRCGGQDIATIMWVFACWGVRPDDVWMGRLYWRTRRLLSGQQAYLKKAKIDLTVKFQSKGNSTQGSSSWNRWMRSSRDEDEGLVSIDGGGSSMSMSMSMTSTDDYTMPSSSGSGSSSSVMSNGLSSYNSREAGDAQGSSSAMDGGCLPPDALSMMLWAFTKLNFRPAKDWLEGCTECLEADNFRQLQPRHFATLLTLLQQLGAPLPMEWLAAYLQAMARQWNSFLPEHWVLVMSSLASCQVQPPLDWLLRVLDTTELQLASMSPAQQASLLCSVTSLNLGTSLSTAWRSAYLEASLAALPGMSAAELAAVSGAMLSVRLRPGQRWLAELIACAKGLEFDANQEQQLVEAITAFGINLRAPPVVVRGKGRPLKSRVYKSGAKVRADVRA